MVDDPDHHVINPDNDSTDLVIKSLGVQHEGIYECYASNVLGTSYSNKIRIKLSEYFICIIYYESVQLRAKLCTMVPYAEKG